MAPSHAALVLTFFALLAAWIPKLIPKRRLPGLESLVWPLDDKEGQRK